MLGEQFLLSVHGSATDLARRVTMRDGVGAVLAKGTDFLLYAIADRIVDGYFPMMDKLGDEIDDLQDQVVQSPNEWTLQRLFTMKKRAPRDPASDLAGPGDLQPADEPRADGRSTPSTSSTSATSTTT